MRLPGRAVNNTGDSSHPGPRTDHHGDERFVPVERPVPHAETLEAG